MNVKIKLLIFAALVAILVWQVAARRGPERAGPARGERAAAAGTEPAPPPAEGGPAAKPSDGAEPAANPQEGVRIRVLAEGRPVDDARVYIVNDDFGSTMAKEAEGTWFAARTGDLVVGAAHARYGPVRRQVNAEAGAITDVTLELPKGETLDLLVLADRGRAPVAGASVYVLRAGGKDLDGGNTGLENLLAKEATEIDYSILGALDPMDFMTVGGAPAVAIPKLLTDAEGRARVEGLPPGTVDLVVSHPDFIATRLKSQPVGKEAVARLASGGSLTVLAPYVDGRAAEGYLCGAVRPGLMFSMPVASTTVDADGKAHFAHLPPGLLRILVAKASHPLALMGLAMGGVVVESEEKGPGAEEAQPKPIAAGNVVIVAGKERTLDLREAKGARIEGMFAGGKGAMVLLQSGDQQVGTQETGEEGRFAFENVPPGRYRLHAGVESGGIARAECEVKEGDEVVTVRLELPMGAISGRVLGTDGKPEKGVQVLVTPKGAPKGQAANLADLLEQLAGTGGTDEEGRFRVQGLVPGAYRVLGGAGLRLDAVEVAVREGEEVSVELRLDDARVRRLLVRLEGADRNPVGGSCVVLGADGSMVEMIALEAQLAIEAGKGSAAFEFFLAPGRYRLVASAPGLAPVLGEAVEMAGDREVTLTFGPGVRVDLTLEGPDGPLAGRDVDIRNESGIRLGGHSPLELLFGGAGLRTDGGGVLALDAVPPGRYIVSVDGKERARLDVAGMPVSRRIRVE